MYVKAEEEPRNRRLIQHHITPEKRKVRNGTLERDASVLIFFYRSHGNFKSLTNKRCNNFLSMSEEEK